MCGIAGLYQHQPPDSTILGRMVNAIHHRGPDSAGFLTDAPFFGGMARLKINDLKTGDQPLFDESGEIVLFYNGEIYNYPELKRQLQSEGVKFKTSSDGEVIPHLYRRLGTDAFKKLDGMFAAAIWDKRTKTLVLARDYPGEKPLFLADLGAGKFGYASEIKSLLEIPGIDRSLDLQSLWDYPTFLWIPQPRTAFKKIRSLMPGELLVIKDGKLQSQRFRYQSKLAGMVPPTETQEWISLIRETVESTVRSRLLSDVPVGAFLSGGLDSSIICTIAAKYRPDLKTFTIGFTDSEDLYHGSADESQQAATTAASLGIEHTIISTDSSRFRQLLDDFVFHGDQPFAVSSGLGILGVASEAQRQGVRVLLSGDGADECFGGYSWYSHLSSIPPSREGSDDPGQNGTLLDIDKSMEDRVKLLEPYSSYKRAHAWHYFASEAEKRQIFSPDLFAEMKSSDRWFNTYSAPLPWSAQDYIHQDREFYFPNEMLQKVDRMTMARSIEGRAPFAAVDIQELAAKLPMEMMIKNGQLKFALREAFADILPKDVIDRKKHGFNVPLDYWLRHEWQDLVQETFSSTSALSRHGFLSKTAERFVHELIHGKKKIIGNMVLSFITLNRWLEKH